MIEYIVKVNVNGDTFWYLNGKRHREDGPAVELANGTTYWYLYDKFHRIDGPAVEFANGAKEWYLNGKRHREEGPAAEYASGEKYWYLNGKYLTEKEHKEATMKGKEVTIDEIESLFGCKVKIVGVNT